MASRSWSQDFCYFIAPKPNLRMVIMCEKAPFYFFILSHKKKKDSDATVLHGKSKNCRSLRIRDGEGKLGEKIRINLARQESFAVLGEVQNTIKRLPRTEHWAGMALAAADEAVCVCALGNICWGWSPKSLLYWLPLRTMIGAYAWLLGYAARNNWVPFLLSAIGFLCGLFIQPYRKQSQDHLT